MTEQDAYQRLTKAGFRCQRHALGWMIRSNGVATTVRRLVDVDLEYLQRLRAKTRAYKTV